MTNNINDNKVYKNIDVVVKNNLLDQIQKYFRVEMLTAMKIYDICESNSVKELQNFLHISEEEADKICEIISNYIKNGKCILHVFPKEMKCNIKEPENKDISDKEIEIISKRYKISTQEIKSKIEQIKQEFKDSNFNDYNNDDILNQVNYFYESTSSGKFDKKPKKAEQIWAVADVLAKLDIIAMAETGTLYLYDSGIYSSKNTENKIHSMAALTGQKLFDACFLERDIENVLFRLKYLKSYSLTEFNKNENIIVVENGLLDIETGELREHTPYEIYTNKFNFAYDPEASLTPTFKTYLETTFKDVEYQIDIIQEFFGYCLSSHYRFAVFLLLLGEGGNGKGVLLNVLTSFIGKENTSGLSLQEICSNDKFALADLFQKKINVCGDISKAKIPNSDNIKKITGRDILRVQFKYGQPFTMYNTAKIINACNEMPKINDETKGFFDRLLIIDFPNSFRDTENDNKNLEAECTTPESLSGILTWAIQGYQRLMKNGKFSHSKSLDQKIEQYQKKVDPLEFYIDKCITENTGGFIKTDLLYKDYVEFAKENDLKIFTGKTFKTKFLEACTEYGIITRIGQKWNPGFTSKSRVFFDITTINTADPQYDDYKPKTLNLNLN